MKHGVVTLKHKQRVAFIQSNDEALSLALAALATGVRAKHGVPEASPWRRLLEAMKRKHLFTDTLSIEAAWPQLIFAAHCATNPTAARA